MDIGLASKLDRKLLVALRTKFHEKPVERAVQFYSSLGENGSLWTALAVGGLAVSKDKKRWAKAVAVSPIALGLNYVIKLSVRRPRPDLPGLKKLGHSVSAHSFPSAHATTSFAAGHVLSTLKPEARPIFLSAAVAMAVSRPYLGMHWPSDIVAGALYGSVIGIALDRFVE